MAVVEYHRVMPWIDMSRARKIATTYYPGNLAVPTYRVFQDDLEVWCRHCNWQGIPPEVAVDYSPASILTEEVYKVSFVCPGCDYSYKADPRHG